MSEEKNIRVVQLLNPDIRPEHVTNQTVQLLNPDIHVTNQTKQDIRSKHVTKQTEHMDQEVFNQVFIIINNFTYTLHITYTLPLRVVLE